MTMLRRIRIVASVLTVALSELCFGQALLPISFMVRELNTPAEARTGEPNLTRGRDGMIYMSWLEQSPDAVCALFISKFDSAGWEPSRLVSSGKHWISNWADFPALAVGENGSIMASWLEKNGKDAYAYGIKLSHSRDGGRSWSVPFSPHRDNTETEHGFVSLIALPDREFGAVWLDGREMVKPEGPMTLRYARIDAEGKLQDEKVIDDKICDCCQTSAIRCGDGSLVVAYRDRSDDEVRDISVVRLTDGNWSKPSSVHNDNWRIKGCPVNGPALSAYEEIVAAAWFTIDAHDSSRVNVAFSRDRGERFGDPVRVDLGSPLGRVDICMLDRSRACVVWMQPEKTEAKIMLRVVTAAGEMSGPLTVATTTSERESGFPHVAFDGERLVVVWTDAVGLSRVKAAQVVIE